MNRVDFPDDENGDVLRRMATGGDDLTQPRDLDFSVVFPREDLARAFARSFVAGNRRLKVTLISEPDEPEIWDVTVSQPMLPTHAGITGFEALIEEAAAPFGGTNDGWGCFSIPKSAAP